MRVIAYSRSNVREILLISVFVYVNASFAYANNLCELGPTLIPPASLPVLGNQIKPPFGRAFAAAPRAASGEALPNGDRQNGLRQEADKSPAKPGD